MNVAPQLRDLGQSLWLDNITRGLLTSGTGAETASPRSKACAVESRC